jgi:peptide-methionine (R)-S-oxide reductase
MARFDRRTFFTAAIAGLGGGAVWLGRPKREILEPMSVTIVQFDNSGANLGPHQVQKVVKTGEEWQKSLTPNQFHITRRGGTEMAFASEFWNSHEDGLFRCVCCGNALFDSQTKFNSGTGWPSFTAPIAEENVRNKTDTSHLMVRTEVLCAQCDAHLGHVFEDGPPPTGLRYCMNSGAMRFVPRKKPSASTTP